MHAASWVDLRTRFPASARDTAYLHLQGVKGWVWGNEVWNAGSDGIPFPKKKRRKKRDVEGTMTGGKGVNLNGFAEQGTFNVTAPTRWVYGNVCTVNGTEYRRDGQGGWVGKDGEVLDLRSLRQR